MRLEIGVRHRKLRPYDGPIWINVILEQVHQTLHLKHKKWMSPKFDID